LVAAAKDDRDRLVGDVDLSFVDGLGVGLDLEQVEAIAG
jgi:hypothetical protein